MSSKRDFTPTETQKIRLNLVSALFEAGWDLKEADHYDQNGITYISVPIGKGVVRFQASGGTFTAISYQNAVGQVFILTPALQNISPKAFAELVTKTGLDD